MSVAKLLTGETRLLIAARGASDYTLTENRVQWRIGRPPFVRDDGACFLVIIRKPDGCSIAIGRQGMCADIHTEAGVTGIPDEMVDGRTRRLWQTGL